MNPPRFLVVVAVVLGTLHVPIRARGADDGPTQAQVNAAIERGVKFLKGKQEPDGAWSYPQNPVHMLGITALSGLALLESGVDRHDPAIVKADDLVRKLAIGSDQTYDVVLAILFLARAQQDSHGPSDELIQRLAGRLAAGEQDGMWGYIVPVGTEAEAADHPHRDWSRAGYAAPVPSITRTRSSACSACGRPAVMSSTRTRPSPNWTSTSARRKAAMDVGGITSARAARPR